MIHGLQLNDTEILYHGTDLKSAQEIASGNILLSKCKESSDFGRGFYLTNSYEKVAGWARIKAKHKESCPAVVCFPVNIKTLFENLNYLVFPNENLDWAQFVVNNRVGIKYANEQKYSLNNLFGQYEMVIGHIADGNIIDISRELARSDRSINVTEMYNICEGHFPLQFSFHSEKALMVLKSFKCYVQEL